MATKLTPEQQAKLDSILGNVPNVPKSTPAQPQAEENYSGASEIARARQLREMNKPQAPEKSYFENVLSGAKDFVVGGAKSIAGGLTFNQGLTQEGAQQTMTGLKDLHGGDEQQKLYDDSKQASRQYGPFSQEASHAAFEAYGSVAMGAMEGAPEAISQGVTGLKNLASDTGSFVKAGLKKPISEAEAATTARAEIPTPEKIKLKAPGEKTVGDISKEQALSTQEVKNIAEQKVQVPPKKGTPLQRKALSESYEQGMNDIVKAKGTNQIPEVHAANKTALSDTLEKFGVKQNPIEEGRGFDFSESPFVKASQTKLAERMSTLVRDWKDLSVGGLNKLRGKLRLLNEEAQSQGGQIGRFGQKLYNDVRSNLGNEALGGSPEVTQLNSQYSNTLKEFEANAAKAKAAQAETKQALTKSKGRLSRETELTNQKIEEVFNKHYDEAISNAEKARDTRAADILKKDRENAVIKVKVWAKENPAAAATIASLLTVGGGGSAIWNIIRK